MYSVAIRYFSIPSNQELGTSSSVNSNFKVRGTSMFYRNWYECGIRFVNDLFDENGSFEGFIKMFDLRTNF